jgi:hypothetical protein
VSHHHQERCVENLNGILETRDDIVIQKIAGHPAHEQIAAAAIEGIFGRYPRISAA